MMQIQNYYQTMTKIYERLQDEESKTLFEARITYLLNKNEDDYTKLISKLYQDWRPSKELEDKMSIVNPKGIIIFGCGYGGKTVKRMLSFWGYETAFFCDNNKFGEIVDGTKVLSVDEAIKEYKDHLIIIGSYRYAEDMYNELIAKGFKDENVLFSKNRLLMWARGSQYFDVFNPQKEEIFVDAGSFDGQTSIDFCKWTDGNYKKIYAFEPVKDMCEYIQKRNIQRIEILNNAVWNKKEKLYFMEDKTGTYINETKGKMVVQGLDIDSVVKDDKVTFIKMDVEGSELMALEGAKNTIINHHPRLAICIYHKPMDVIEIPAYILELVPEYKFYIRHYGAHMWETVLYAVL